jgi:hypothetical protein
MIFRILCVLPTTAADFSCTADISMTLLVKLQILLFVFVEDTNFVVTGPVLQLEAIPIESGHSFRTAACGCWSLLWKLLINRTQNCACTQLVVLHCPNDYRYLCFVESVWRACCIDIYRNSAKTTHRMSCCNGYRPDSYSAADVEFPSGYFSDSWQPIPEHVEMLCR